MINGVLTVFLMRIFVFLTGSKKEAYSISGRIVFITTFAFTVLLAAHYNSWLYSMLTVTKTVLPFNSLEEITKDSSYNFGYLKGYAIESEMQVQFTFKCLLIYIYVV